jgi:lipopolysaccharide export system protein LptA
VNARIAILSAVALAAAAAPAASLAQINPDGGDIVIEADTLDIFNEQGLTVYEGRVDAVQGDTQLRADRLELYSDPAAGSAGLGDMGDVVRAIAIGNVYYVTPEQVATGDRAVYDVAADTVTLTGGQVVVTQGCDVLTGTEVVMNLTTNDAQVRAGPAADGRPGRVRTVIRSGDEAAPAPGCEQ